MLLVLSLLFLLVFHFKEVLHQYISVLLSCNTAKLVKTFFEDYSLISPIQEMYREHGLFPNSFPRAYHCRHCNVQPLTILRNKGASAVVTSNLVKINQSSSPASRQILPTWSPESPVTCKSLDTFQEDAVLYYKPGAHHYRLLLPHLERQTTCLFILTLFNQLIFLL